jgi:hypothetical protein
MTQAVSQRLSPKRPGFETGPFHVGYVVNEVALDRIFLRVLRFSLSISFHRDSAYPYFICGMKIGPLVAADQRRRLTPST